MKAVKTKPEWNRIAIWAGVIVALYLSLWVVSRTQGDYVTRIIIALCINVITATSLNVINGFSGQFSIGHSGLMAVGAWTGALITLNAGPALHMTGAPLMFVGTVVGGAVAGLFGLIIGIPALRLRGDYLAIATLCFGEIIRLTILNIEALGGATGIPGIPRVMQLHWGFVAAVVVVILVANTVRSSIGRALQSVREDEVAAETMGINTFKYKVLAFVIGSFFAGVAGGLYAHNFYVINPKNFSFGLTFNILVMVVLGGQGSVTGAVLGAAAFTVVDAFLQSYTADRMIIFSLILIVMMLLRPEGLLGARELTLDPLLGKEAGRHEPAVDSKAL